MADTPTTCVVSKPYFFARVGLRRVLADAEPDVACRALMATVGEVVEWFLYHDYDTGEQAFGMLQEIVPREASSGGRLCSELTRWRA